LLRARVSIVGLGGLGGGVTEILARIGIGRLNLIDGDDFEDSNLNRQFLSTCDLLATPKAQAAVQRVHQINPSVEVLHHRRFLTQENSLDLLAESDLVVDCLDNLKTRFELEHACKKIRAPLVSAAVAGSSGQLTTIFPDDNGFRLIYGDPHQAPLKGAETALGTMPYSVTTLAALECAEVVKVLLNRGTLLRNRLLIADLMDATFDIVSLQ
jgi:molybdopterin-synthase adenylyltransferase